MIQAKFHIVKACADFIYQRQVEDCAADKASEHDDDRHVRCELLPHRLVRNQIEHNKHGQDNLAQEADQHMQKDVESLGFTNLVLLLLAFENSLLTHNILVCVFINLNLSLVIAVSVDAVGRRRRGNLNWDELLLDNVFFVSFAFRELARGHIQVLSHNVVSDLANEAD